jgi:hypothetical protein
MESADRERGDRGRLRALAQVVELAVADRDDG